MPIPKKGTPEYDAWKNSPQYEEYVQKSSLRIQKKWDDPAYRQSITEKRREAASQGRHRKPTVDFFSRVQKDSQTECWLWLGRVDSTGRCVYDAMGKGIVAQRWSYEYHKGLIPEGAKLSCSCENSMCVNPDHLGILGKDIHHTFTLTAKQKISKANKLVWEKGTLTGDLLRDKIAKSAYQTPGTPEYETWNEKKSTSQKGKKLSPEHKAKVADARKGATYSNEAKANLSLVRKRRWQALSEDEKNAQVEQLRRSSEKIIDSWIEQYYAQQLDAQGKAYERQKRIGWYRVDFYIASENRIVELNGCYWHCCEHCGYGDAHPGKREKDAKRYEYLQRKGYIVEIVWEHDLPRKPRQR